MTDSIVSSTFYLKIAPIRNMRGEVTGVRIDGAPLTNKPNYAGVVVTLTLDIPVGMFDVEATLDMRKFVNPALIKWAFESPD